VGCLGGEGDREKTSRAYRAMAAIAPGSVDNRLHHGEGVACNILGIARRSNGIGI
jgi:hypothetical protein